VTGGGSALLTVGPNGSIQAADGNSITLNSATGSTLNNAGTLGNNAGGTISMVNGRAGDVLTLPGTFSGSGDSRLTVDAQLGATPAVDRLIIGGAATGVTTIQLNPVAGSAPQFNAGTIVVQAGAASDAGAFQLPGVFVDQGLVRSELTYNPTDFSYQLTGTPSDAAFETDQHAPQIDLLLGRAVAGLRQAATNIKPKVDAEGVVIIVGGMGR
jgi:hypothetical protein